VAQRWPIEAIHEEIASLLPGFEVEVAARLDSTNSELMRRARAGRTQPVLLLAEEQTAGRGRLGRRWDSGVGDSLTFSLGVTLAPRDWSGLSLAVGVGLAESLHPDVALKWPNDLWWRGRKLAGILVETAALSQQREARHAVIGVGINISPGDRQHRGIRASLREIVPGMDAAQALKRVAAPLVSALQAFERGGFVDFQGRFAARDALRGLQVTVHDGAQPFLQGLACGVDGMGALLVHTSSGMKPVSSHEVSVRSLPAATA
jgi:BirA family transcriptional regulator, biotin operon repressor / biotin---[acetyl-CoA-carboxylase] ligase